MYFGELGTIPKPPGECLDPDTPLPGPKQTITVCGSRYLRDTAPGQSLGNVIGVVAVGTAVHVNDVKTINLSAHAKAVWLNVSLRPLSATSS